MSFVRILLEKDWLWARLRRGERRSFWYAKHDIKIVILSNRTSPYESDGVFLVCRYMFAWEIRHALASSFEKSLFFLRRMNNGMTRLGDSPLSTGRINISYQWNWWWIAFHAELGSSARATYAHSMQYDRTVERVSSMLIFSESFSLSNLKCLL